MLRDEELVKVIEAAFERYQGDVTIVETAIGALVIGRMMGWKPLFLIHANPTIKRYEQVLEVRFRDVLPESGRLAKKSVAWRVVEAGKHFWDVVRARVPGRSLAVE
jgi:hypothetical protein